MSPGQCEVGCSAGACNHTYVVTKGQRHLEERVPILLGFSPGNTYFYNDDNLKSMLQFAISSSDQVCYNILIFFKT